MPLKYLTGEDVRKGDHVLLHGDPGEIEFVVDPLMPSPDTLWFIEEYGQGVMIIKLKQLGTVFTDPEQNDELDFVSRAL